MKKKPGHIIILPEVDSSNNYAIHLINSKIAVHGTIVMALCQSKGKGQRGNSWISEANKNLLASIILLPEFLAADKQFYLSKIASLAILSYLKKETSDVSVKWPNDIYCGNKKISGILIENMVQGDSIYSSVVGIGLNLNQMYFNDDIPNPVSLKILTGKEYISEDVIEIINDNFFRYYEMLISGNVEIIDKEYLDNIYLKNIWSKFRKGDRIFEARISNIGPFGQLVTEEHSGIFTEHMFGDIDYLQT